MCFSLLWTGCVAQESQEFSRVGPHSEPEEVVRAYIEAILADDCQTAESLVAPSRRESVRHRILQECANDMAPFLISADIEDIMIEQWDSVTIVTLFGDFYTDLGQQSRRRAYNDQVVYSAEEVDGKWFVKP
jgi:hypothetical protein